MRFHLPERRVLAWALYDWGNSAYATAVMAGFFPVFFKQYWATDLEAATSTAWLGRANALSSLLIVLLAPLLGAIADRAGWRKHLLLLFAAGGILATGGLSAVGGGDWPLAATLYVLATLGFMGANVFYDALLPAIAGERELDRASALGFGLGYLGGGLLFSFCVLMTQAPEWFGLDGAQQAVRLSFLLVALWWGVFTLPLLLLVPEPPARRAAAGVTAAVRGGLEQLSATFHQLRRMRVVGLFLLAYWLYIDGVDTIVRMAVDYGLALKFEARHLIAALLIIQFVGFPAALAFGRIGERLGAKTGILIAVAVYILVVIWAYFMDTVREFYLLAVVVGLVQGGVQSLSRSLYARIIPADKSAEFFGFYNMLGKFAAVAGPLLVGQVGLASGSPRLGMLSLLLLFFTGALLLLRVDVEAGRRLARGL